MANIAAFQARIKLLRYELQQALIKGKTSTVELAIMRGTVDLMEAQLKESPRFFATMYEDVPGASITQLSGLQRWELAARRQVSEEINPGIADPEKWQKVFDEYQTFCLRYQSDVDMSTKVTIDKFNGKQWIYRNNPLIVQIRQMICTELMNWIALQKADRGFYSMTPRQGLIEMLSQRKDLQVALRVSQVLDKDLLEYGEFRPEIADQIEFLVGMIPVIGNLVAAYEIFSGRDLWGDQLSALERGILAASILLPWAGKFYKYGRALYSEARLVRLYGSQNKAWIKAMSRAGYLERNPEYWRIIQRSRDAIVEKRELDRKLAQEAADALAKLAKATLEQQSLTEAEKVAEEILQKFVAKYPKVAQNLDRAAMARILEKVPWDKEPDVYNNIKGQILEELIGPRVLPMLNGRAGGLALGLKIPPGKQIEYIPGFRIFSDEGLLTDGMLVYREKNTFVVVAVFEAKAGSAGARGLSLGKSKLSKEAEEFLDEQVRYQMKEEKDIARLAGKPYNRTFEEVKKEYIKSEAGGQVRRDVERLSEAAVYIDGQLAEIKFSPTKSKFFGVVPSDAKTNVIENIKKQLTAAGVNFEIIGADVKERELVDMAADIKKMATKSAPAPAPGPQPSPSPTP